jgi:hypothetical protein
MARKTAGEEFSVSIERKEKMCSELQVHHPRASE